MTGRLKIAAWCLAWALLAPLVLLSQVRWNRSGEKPTTADPSLAQPSISQPSTDGAAFRGLSPAGRLPIDPLWTLTLPGQRTALRSGDRLDGLGMRERTGPRDRTGFERGKRSYGSETDALVPSPDAVDNSAPNNSAPETRPHRRRSTDRKPEWNLEFRDDAAADVAPFGDEQSVQPEPLPDQFAGRFDTEFPEPPQAPNSAAEGSDGREAPPDDEPTSSPEKLEIKVIELPKSSPTQPDAEPDSSLRHGGSLREGARRSYKSVSSGDQRAADAGDIAGLIPRPSVTEIDEKPAGSDQDSAGLESAAPTITDPRKPANTVPANPPAPEEIDGLRLYVYKPVAVSPREFARMIAPVIAEFAQHDSSRGSRHRTQAMLSDSGLIVTATPAVHRMLAALLDRLEATSTPPRRSSATIRCMLVRAQLSHTDRVGYDTAKLRQVFPGSVIQRIEPTPETIANAPGVHAAADDCRVNLIDASFESVTAGLKSLGHVEVLANPVLALTVGEWADATLHTPLIDHSRVQSLDYQHHVADSSQAGLAARIRLAAIMPGNVQLDVQPKRRSSAVTGVTNAGYRLKLDGPVSMTIPASATAIFGGVFTEELQTVAMPISSRGNSLDLWNTPTTTAVQTTRSEWLLVISAESEEQSTGIRTTAKIIPVPLRVNRNVRLASERSKSSIAPVAPAVSRRTSQQITATNPVSPLPKPLPPSHTNRFQRANKLADVQPAGELPQQSAPVSKTGAACRMAIPVGHQIVVDVAASKRSPGPDSPGKSGRVSDDIGSAAEAQSDSDRVELLPPPPSSESNSTPSPE